MLKINKPGVVYYDRPKPIIFKDDWILDYQKINDLKQHTLSVLDFSSEHYGVAGIDHVHNALESAGVNFLLLSHEPSDHLKFSKMLFYPYWYYWSRKNFIVGSGTNERKYKWSCLNANPRTHRIYNYFYSRQQPYFDSACFAFYNAEVHRPDDVELDNEVNDFWNKNKDTMPIRTEVISDRGRPDAVCDLPAFTDSYIHLVTETTVIPRIGATEKTWKPVASGQMFLIFGNKGIVSYLRDQGVDVFDDIIDHSYDQIDDWKTRLYAIHVQLKQLMNKDLKDLYIATQHRRDANVRNFFSGAFGNKYQQTLLQYINELS